MRVLIFYIFTFCLIIQTSIALDATTAAEAKDAIETYFKENTGWLAKTIRLIFHDCVSDSCDGCINTDNDSNAGLSDVIDALDEVYVGAYDSDMSRADFWALSAIVAIERGVRIANGENCDFGECPEINMPDITFYSGRTDCSTSPTTDETFDFPDGSLDRTELLEYFTDHFGYTTDEVVALMGAHSMGRNRISNSGYSGTFDATSSALDNQYYKDMVDDSVTWTNEEITRSGKWQFSGADSSGSDVGTRLNTDLVLAYDLTINDDNSCSCTIGTDCDQADSYDLVSTYAEDADTWAADFAAIMEKLMSTGYDDLTEPE